MRRFTLITVLICVQLSMLHAQTEQTTTIDGTAYIMHEVKEKETLYSLSRKYDVPISQIVKHNPTAEFGLELGQTVRVPFSEEKDEPEVLEKPVIKIRKDTVTAHINKKLPKNASPAERLQHIVEPGQTLFSISRQYFVSVDEIKEWNGLIGNSLSVGQELTILPRKELSLPAAKEVDPRALTHTVQPSETLYSISKKYGVHINELKRWNNLKNNEISIDQLLIVGFRLNPTPTAVNDEGEDLIKRPAALSKEVKPEEEKPKEVVTEPIVTQISESPVIETNFNEVYESGLAQMIEGSQSGRKYLGLHRTAPVGTIMKVRNEMNDQEVFVRVIGKLPDTSLNKNVVIKISRAAYERLGAIDPKFRVKLSYIP